jgi:RNA 3'-terminal phosphate cyclase (ATP)
MDGPKAATGARGDRPAGARKRWVAHAPQAARGPRLLRREGITVALDPGPVTLDGSHGEGGGQVLRTALALALLTGRPFRITRLRANREKPGLRPQHLAAVQAAAALCGAEVRGLAVGAREVVFRPAPYRPGDLTLDIGTAGATALVLHTLHLPLAMRAAAPVRLALVGGTFNEKAPSYPFLESTWRPHLARLGLGVGLAMPAAGFYPLGGGTLEAWIEPATPRALTLLARGPLRALRGVSGVLNLHRGDVAERMRARASELLSARGLDAAIEPADWPGRGAGAAIALTAEFEHTAATFVGLGARGKPAERVAEEAVAQLLDYLDAEGAGAVDAHSADQMLLPLALAEGPSAYTVAEVTEHLRTNARTIRAFLDREIAIVEPEGGAPGRVEVA